MPKIELNPGFENIGRLRAIFLTGRKGRIFRLNNRVLSTLICTFRINPIAMKPLSPMMVVLFILLLTPDLGAQSYRPTRIFQHRQADAWMGIGLFPTYAKDASRMTVPPVSFGTDWMAGNQVSIGLSVGYSLYQIEKIWPGEVAVRHYATNTLQWMTRIATHYTRMDNLDILGGIQVGGQITLVDSKNGPFGNIEHLHGMKPKKFRLLYGAFFGARLAVSPNFTLLGELGTGVSFLQIGFGVKIF